MIVFVVTAEFIGEGGRVACVCGDAITAAVVVESLQREQRRKLSNHARCTLHHDLNVSFADWYDVEIHEVIA